MALKLALSSPIQSLMNQDKYTNTIPFVEEKNAKSRQATHSTDTSTQGPTYYIYSNMVPRGKDQDNAIMGLPHCLLTKDKFQQNLSLFLDDAQQMQHLYGDGEIWNEKYGMLRKNTNSKLFTNREKAEAENTNQSSENF